MKKLKIKNIIIPLGDPKSVFIELLIKYFKSKNYKSLKKKIILIGSNKIIKSQKKKFNLHLNINCIKDINDNKLKRINIIDINFENFKNKYNHKIATKKYIERCLNLSLSIIKNNSNSVLFNGPISKKEFLEKKFLGITEYLAKKTKSKDFAMLIYNSELSVCPITTHLPIKFVAKNINKKKIINKVSLINKFYKKKLNRSPKFAILGLNPHCETILKYSEEDKIIKPAINLLKSKKIKINGPISADTFFIKKNINVNCISPGFITTEMTDKINDEHKELLKSRIPMSRFGSPNDIAYAVIFLSSNLSDYITGETIHVNGGMYFS